HAADVVRSSSAAPAMISPAVTGTNPACTVARQGALRNRYHKPTVTKVSTEDGPHIPAVATSAPASPATRQPTRVATCMFGPGAACASAKSAANSCALIHG